VTLQRTGDLVEQASRSGRAIAAFNVITLEHAEAIAAAAEVASQAVILQISQNAVIFHGGRLRPIASAMAAVARSSSTAIAMHLDHVDDDALLKQAADCGFSSVMYDAGALPYEQNVAQTAAATTWAHSVGLWMEAELGYVGGKPASPASAHTAGVRTDPAEARQFTSDTGVDALAVAVGTSHAMATRTAAVDAELIARLRAALPVPLVLHGSSGLSDRELTRAVEAGMTKINVGTALNVAMTKAVRALLAADESVSDPRYYLAPARTEMSAVVTSVIAALERARPPAAD